MDSSSDSLPDFWNEVIVEKKSVGVSVAWDDIKPEVPNQKVDLIEEAMKECPNEYFRDRMIKLLNQQRIGSDLNHANEMDKQIRKLNREYNHKIQELAKKQQTDLLIMKKDYDSLKVMLQEKDVEIDRLQKIIIEQEMPLIKQRLYKRILKAATVQKEVEAQNTDDFEQEIKALKLQIMGMKELVKTYQEQTEKAEKNLKTCEALLKSTQEKSALDISRLQEEKAKSENELQSQINDMNNKYKQFKEEVRKEIELSQLVIRQQIETNTALKNELKSAKMVLITPRLREKFVHRLKPDLTPETMISSILNESRIRTKKLNKKELTLENLISTRASPADISMPDINNINSMPVVGLFPEISSRHLS